MGRVSLTVGRVRCLSVSSSSSSLDVTSDDPRHVNDVNVDVIDVISSRHKLTGDSRLSLARRFTVKVKSESNKVISRGCYWLFPVSFAEIAQVSHRKTRQLTESIHTRREVNCMNRDGGAYSLPTTYDRILVTCSSATSRDHMPDEVRRWRTKRRNYCQLGINFTFRLCNMNVVINLIQPNERLQTLLK